MTEFTIKKSKRAYARGRSGYFSPRAVWISAFRRLAESDPLSDTVEITVNSSHNASSPPAMLRLPREEMRDLANALLAVCEVKP